MLDELWGMIISNLISPWFDSIMFWKIFGAILLTALILVISNIKNIFKILHYDEKIIHDRSIIKHEYEILPEELLSRIFDDLLTYDWYKTSDAVQLDILIDYARTSDAVIFDKKVNAARLVFTNKLNELRRFCTHNFFPHGHEYDHVRLQPELNSSISVYSKENDIEYYKYQKELDLLVKDVKTEYKKYREVKIFLSAFRTIEGEFF